MQAAMANNTAHCSDCMLWLSVELTIFIVKK